MAEFTTGNVVAILQTGEFIIEHIFETDKTERTSRVFVMSRKTATEFHNILTEALAAAITQQAEG